MTSAISPTTPDEADGGSGSSVVVRKVPAPIHTSFTPEDNTTSATDAKTPSPKSDTPTPSSLKSSYRITIAASASRARKTSKKKMKGVIHPRHPTKVKWDLFCGVLIIYSVLIVPFRIGECSTSFLTVAGRRLLPHIALCACTVFSTHSQKLYPLTTTPKNHTP